MRACCLDAFLQTRGRDTRLQGVEAVWIGDSLSRTAIPRRPRSAFQRSFSKRRSRCFILVLLPKCTILGKQEVSGNSRASGTTLTIISANEGIPIAVCHLAIYVLLCLLEGNVHVAVKT